MDKEAFDAACAASKAAWDTCELPEAARQASIARAAYPEGWVNQNPDGTLSPDPAVP